MFDVSGREPSGSPTAQSDCLWIALVDDFRTRKAYGKTVAVFLSLFAWDLGPVRTHQKTSFCSIRGENHGKAGRPLAVGEAGGGGRGGGALKPHHTAPSSGRKAKSVTALPTVLRHRGV